MRSPIDDLPISVAGPIGIALLDSVDTLGSYISNKMTAENHHNNEQDKRRKHLNKQYTLEEKKQVYNHIGKFTTGSNLQALWNLFHPLVAFSFFWWMGGFWGLLIAGLIRTRIFVTFHDIAHLAFFPSENLNKFFGVIMGTICLTPFSYWSRGHNYHHKHSNNLEKQQYAQTAPWTKEKFLSMKPWQQKCYAAIYSGFALFTYVPTLYFFVIHRIFAKWYENLLVFSMWYLEYHIGGTEWLFKEFITCQIAAVFGFFLFHAQHTFSGTYKRRGENWDYFENGIKGSSFLQVPWFLQYFTFSIEYHHIHHLNTHVPAYNLRACHEASGELFKDVPRVTFLETFKSFNYSIWDEPREVFESAFDYVI